MSLPLVNDPSIAALADGTGTGQDGTVVAKAVFVAIATAIDGAIVSPLGSPRTPGQTTDEVIEARGNMSDLDARIAGVIDANGIFIGVSGTQDVNVVATAGATIAGGQVAYLSDGSDGNTAGLWFLGASGNGYSSSGPRILGIAPSAITIATTGVVRTSGRVTGLTGLVAGTTYFVNSVAGGLTATKPAANARVVGIADTTTSLILQAVQPGIGSVYSSFAAATTTKNNNTTLVNVTGLAFPVQANADYRFQFTLHYATNLAAQLKTTLTGPAAPTGLRFGISRGPGALITSGSRDAFAAEIWIETNTTNDETLVMTGFLRNGATAGTVQFQFAQGVATAVNTVIYLNSEVVAVRV